MAKEVVGGVVEHIANRIFRAAHDAFHPVDRAQVVAAIDPFAAAGPNQNVLGVVGHTDNFVRHHLANGKNQIESAARNQLDWSAPAMSSPACLQTAPE